MYCFPRVNTLNNIEFKAVFVDYHAVQFSDFFINILLISRFGNSMYFRLLSFHHIGNLFSVIYRHWMKKEQLSTLIFKFNVILVNNKRITWLFKFLGNFDVSLLLMIRWMIPKSIWNHSPMVLVEFRSHFVVCHTVCCVCLFLDCWFV